MMQVFINDQVFEVPIGSSLSEVLKSTEIKTENIAVAMDFIIIPKAAWPTTTVHAGAKIMVIRAAQGG